MTLEVLFLLQIAFIIITLIGLGYLFVSKNDIAKGFEKLRHDHTILKNENKELKDSFSKQTERVKNLTTQLVEQIQRYNNCIDELENLRSIFFNITTQDLKFIKQILDTDGIDSLRRNYMNSEKRQLNILSILPEVHDYPKLDLDSDIESILDSGFTHSKLEGKTIGRFEIVNELELNPEITFVHIGSHGTIDGIVLSNNGKGDIVEPSWFGKVFSRKHIKCVVIFSCKSQIVVDTIYRMGIPCVVGFRDNIKDQQTVEFVKAFYQHLQATRNVETAITTALLSVNSDFEDEIIVRGNFIFK